VKKVSTFYNLSRVMSWAVGAR